MDTVQKKIDYFNVIFSKIKNQEISFAMYQSGFCHTLYQLVQEYPKCLPFQKSLIESSLKKSVDFITSYLIPIDFSENNYHIVPIKVLYPNLLKANKKNCYQEGDLQIALLLFRISFVLKDGDLFHLANMIASFSKMRENEDLHETMSIDFKTGTIGVALLYQTIFFLTGLRYYKNQSEYWYLKSKNIQTNLSESLTGVELSDHHETQRAFEAFENPQNDTWRKLYFLEYDIA